MSAPPDYLRDLLFQLIALFNQQSSDLPHMAIHKDCVFRLNGVAYHEQLGRPVTDPIVRLIGCGPAAYRLLLTGIRYAVSDPHLAAEPIDDDSDRPAHTTGIYASLSGRLRGSDRPFRSMLEIRATATLDGQLRELAVTMGDADVEMLLAARRRR
jgi:hypothetical protein